MSKAKVPVLILSAHAIALGVARSLAPCGIPVFTVSYSDMDMAPKSRYVKKNYILPHPKKNPLQFIEGLLQIGKELKKALVLPADDQTLVILSQNLKILSSHYVIATPSWNVIEKIISKDQTYRIAEEAGIPVPKTRVLDISSLLPTEELLQEFQFPFLLKPAQSHLYYDVFQCKMKVVKNREELETHYRACQKNRLNMTAQRIIQGDHTQGYNYNSLHQDGKLLAGFCGQKMRMTKHGYGVPTVVQSCRIIPELEDYSLRLLSLIDYEGYSCIEYKYDIHAGKYMLLEINGRYNRSSLLSVKSGLNFPKIHYNYLIEGQCPSQMSYRNGVYYIDEFRDLEASMKDILCGRLPLTNFLKPYVSEHIKAIFSPGDLKPFVKRTSDGLRLLFQPKTKFIAENDIPASQPSPLSDKSSGR